MTYQRVYRERPKAFRVCPGLKNGRRGWLLRWREYPPSCTRYGVVSTYWFVDQDEALAVRAGMASGLSFDEAFRQMWHRIQP